MLAWLHCCRGQPCLQHCSRVVSGLTGASASAVLTKGYEIAARMGRIGNSLSDLVLALSQTLQTTGVDAQVQGMSDASLQVFAYMTRDLGRLLPTLTVARCQVWLAQA